MPKRIIDGEGLWRSDRIAMVEPKKFRSEYAWLLPLALANGVFECDPRAIWCDAYAFNRPDVTLGMVAKILDEFERVGLLFRWVDDEKEKIFGFWVSSERSGRLPPMSRLTESHESIGPWPPISDLLQFTKEKGIAVDVKWTKFVRERAGQKTPKNQVYFIQDTVTHNVKIGMSCSPMARFSAFQIGSPRKLKFLGSIAGGYLKESEMHAKFHSGHVRGEWFKMTKELAIFIEENAKIVNCEEVHEKTMDTNGIHDLKPTPKNGRGLGVGSGLGIGLGLGSGLGEGVGEDNGAAAPESESGNSSSSDDEENTYCGIDLDPRQDLMPWMRNACRSVGKRWRHDSTKNNKGPIGGMVPALVEKGNTYKLNLRRWWIDYLHTDESDQVMYPYSDFLNRYINGRVPDLFSPERDEQIRAREKSEETDFERGLS